MHSEPTYLYDYQVTSNVGNRRVRSLVRSAVDKIRIEIHHCNSAICYLFYKKLIILVLLLLLLNNRWSDVNVVLTKLFSTSSGTFLFSGQME